jgi:hypothetical protein
MLLLVLREILWPGSRRSVSFFVLLFHTDAAQQLALLAAEIGKQYYYPLNIACKTAPRNHAGGGQVHTLLGNLRIC